MVRALGVRYAVYARVSYQNSKFRQKITCSRVRRRNENCLQYCSTGRADRTRPARIRRYLKHEHVNVVLKAIITFTITWLFTIIFSREWRLRVACRAAFPKSVCQVSLNLIFWSRVALIGPGMSFAIPVISNSWFTILWKWHSLPKKTQSWDKKQIQCLRQASVCAGKIKKKYATTHPMHPKQVWQTDGHKHEQTQTSV